MMGDGCWVLGHGSWVYACFLTDNIVIISVGVTHLPLKFAARNVIIVANASPESVHILPII